MTTWFLWLWPVVVLGSVAAVGLWVTHQDDVKRRERHLHPGE